jgi:Raf kinase inhibitor-like YbhB/YbcL family protein
MQISRFITTTVAVVLNITLSLGVAYGQGGRGRGPGIPPPLKITIPGFTDGGAIPSTYGCVAGKNANLSPAIQWSGAPEGTVSFALILHDTDLMLGAEDVLHWGIFNIPASATGLPEGVAAKATLDDGSSQLTNIGRGLGYFNPCPPPPTVHHYIWEFFALDTKLDPAPASRADFMKAITGHVKAKGTYVGTYHQ